MGSGSGADGLYIRRPGDAQSWLAQGSVDLPLRCGGDQGTGDLTRDLQYVEQSHAGAHTLTERVSVDKFGRNESRIGDRADLVNSDYVRMIEGRGSFCLLNETLQALLVASNVRRQDLDRYRAVEFSICSEIYLTHAAFSDLRSDLKPSKLSAGL